MGNTYRAQQLTGEAIQKDTDFQASPLKHAGAPRRWIRTVPNHRPADHRRNKLRVLKFGGTSVGDAVCIQQAIEIIRAAKQDGDVVVVVSAMSGVTNGLFEAAKAAEEADINRVLLILSHLRRTHRRAARALISSSSELNLIQDKIKHLIDEADHLCQTSLLQKLTDGVRDSIASIGERLSAPLIAGALRDRGLASEDIEATELIVTDRVHGGAEPQMSSTREHCEKRLLPLLLRGMIPVVTGYIGATAEGVLTTLGRGGSDYSATVIAAALSADEVIIWTDVDGLLTADPRLVPGTSVIREISYREATELAFFGAKVLHPKTLRPLVRSGIPVWIRNTFLPENAGTKITLASRSNGPGVKAVTAITDAALISTGGSPNALDRMVKAVSAGQAKVLSILQSSSEHDLCFVIPSISAKRLLESLQTNFAQDLANGELQHMVYRKDVTRAWIATHGELLTSASSAECIAP